MRQDAAKNSKSAFSLVEVLIVMFIAGVAFTSFYYVSAVGTRYIIESKNRLAATALANEKMEIVRNLEYDNVGTQGSIDIPGNIPQEEDIVANGRSYHVSTSVRYEDDPMDGTITSSPVDTIPNDYKIVTVTISWKDIQGVQQGISSTSRFVPPGLETSVGGSPLSINVIDGGTLLPVPQATVHIVNDTVVPAINDSIQTDDDGHIMLPAARISSGSQVTITKNGYETIVTMDTLPDFIPTYGHISVIEGFLNTYDYIQNKLSSITIKTADYQNNQIGNIEFSIGGGKVIGRNALEEDIFSMTEATDVTDAINGEKAYVNISPGEYTVTMSPNAQYEFIDFDPSMAPAILFPDNLMTYTVRIADKSINAIFLEIKDADSSSGPISGAKVTLTDGATDIFTQKESSLRGVVFYPDGPEVLDAKTYTLKIEADGYVTQTHEIDISALTKISVQLVKI